MSASRAPCKRRIGECEGSADLVCDHMIVGQRLSQEQRFRKAFPPPSSSLLKLTQAYSSQGLPKTSTLAEVGRNELE